MGTADRVSKEHYKRAKARPIAASQEQQQKEVDGNCI